VRHVWKAAELRADARVLGLLAYRIETTPSQAGRGPRYPFNHRTRRYLRRRVWRTLRRLGQLGDLDYTTLAAGVLLAVTDADGREPRSATDGRGRPFHYDRFARFLAWNHILYGASARYHLPKNGKAWRLRAPHRPDAPPPSTREEAFATLWEQRPAALMQLCAESACLPVHQFAAKALLACPAFLDQLDVDDAALLLGRPYDPTAAVGLVGRAQALRRGPPRPRAPRRGRVLAPRSGPRARPRVDRSSPRRRPRRQPAPRGAGAGAPRRYPRLRPSAPGGHAAGPGDRPGRARPVDRRPPRPGPRPTTRSPPTPPARSPPP
jgi:hypothetical protein